MQRNNYSSLVLAPPSPFQFLHMLKLPPAGVKRYGLGKWSHIKTEYFENRYFDYFTVLETQPL
jgi:hypothetical protein